MMSMVNLLDFYTTIGKLKTIKRSGWISHVGILNPESVADHSFRCAIVAMCISDLKGINSEKLMKMLLLHDIQEARTGDFDSYSKEQISISELTNLERSAVENVLSLLPSTQKERYTSIWKEFEDKKTEESILANEIDKIEMIMQALEYEKEGYDAEKLETFWISVQDKIQTPLIKELFVLLNDRK